MQRERLKATIWLAARLVRERIRTCGAKRSQNPRRSRTFGRSAQGVNATPQVKQARLACRKEVSVKRGKYRPRQKPFTPAQIVELWARRAAGESGTRIARHMGRYPSSVRDYIHEAGGIRPPPSRRSPKALTMQEREEISRGLAGRGSLRAIAGRIGRAPAKGCRRVARHSRGPDHSTGSSP